jgi:monoamine oxidase
MNTQGNLSESGFLDHLCFWALGDCETTRMWDKTSRYKIHGGTSALAQAMLDDCQNVHLLLSTPIVSVYRTNDNSVTICTQSGQLFIARAAIIMVPLNALHNKEFLPKLIPEKQRAVTEGQCRGGTKFWAKLEGSVGNWCGFAPYPSPITIVYTDDRQGTTIVGFSPDNALDIRDVRVAERELQKFLPSCKVKCVFGHDWRNDSFVQNTWSWYRPGQISSNLHVPQTQEAPLFFASGVTTFF